MDDVGYIESKRNTGLERDLQRDLDAAGMGRQAAGPVEGEANGLQDLCRRVRAFQEELDAMGMGRPAAEEPAEGVALEAIAGPRFLQIGAHLVNLEHVIHLEFIHLENGKSYVHFDLTNGVTYRVEHVDAARVVSILAPEVV